MCSGTCAGAAGSEVMSNVHLAVTFLQQGWFAMLLATLLVMLIVMLVFIAGDVPCDVASGVRGVTCDVCDVAYHVHFYVACDVVSVVCGVACKVICACDFACDVVSGVCGVPCDYAGHFALMLEVFVMLLVSQPTELLSEIRF